MQSVGASDQEGFSGDDQGGGPVSLSQILERDVCASLPERAASDRFDTTYTASCSLKLAVNESSISDTKSAVLSSISVDRNSDNSEVISSRSLPPKSECYESKSGGVSACRANTVSKSAPTTSSRETTLKHGTAKVIKSHTSLGGSNIMPGQKLPPISNTRNMGNGNSSPNSTRRIGEKTVNLSSSGSTKSANTMSATVKEVYPSDYIYVKEKLKEVSDKLNHGEQSLNVQKVENSALKRDLKAKIEQIAQLKRENDKLKVGQIFSYLCVRVGQLFF